jgi:hypothetical protein
MIAGDPTFFDHRLENLLAAGKLCQIAWNGFSSLKRNGSDAIAKIIGKNDVRATREVELDCGKSLICAE